MYDLRVECIFPRTTKEFNKFIRGMEMKSTKVINYASIKTKLSKSDPYGEDPSDSVIGLTIVNDISRSLRSEKKQIDKIIYLLRDLDSNKISNLKEILSELTDREFKINLTMLYSTKDIPEDSSQLFDSIKFISDDQA